MTFLFKSETIDYNFFNNNKPHTILFLHGWGGNKNSFNSTINLIKNTYNILTITIPTIQPTIEQWNLNDFCELILRILETNNIKNLYLVCHSFGFRIATLLKEKIKIEKLVVTGGAGPKKITLLNKIKNNNNKLLLQNKKFKFLYEKVASNDYINLSPSNKQTFKNIVNFNTLNLLKFNCPILIFWGLKDTDTKFWIAKKIKHQNNAILIKTKSDHFAYLKLNQQFNHSIVKFFKE